MALIDKPHFRNVYRSALHDGIFVGAPVPTREDAEKVANPRIRPIYRLRVYPHPSRMVARQQAELRAQRKVRKDRFFLAVGLIAMLMLALGLINLGLKIIFELL